MQMLALSLTAFTHHKCWYIFHEIIIAPLSRNKNIQDDFALETKFITACESVMRISMFFCSFCQQEKLPMTFQSCVIPTECQVSEWSEWSPCSKTCHDVASPKGTRRRTRTIRQFPIGSEKECPELEEKETCVSQGDAAVPCAMWVNKGLPPLLTCLPKLHICSAI